MMLGVGKKLANNTSNVLNSSKVKQTSFKYGGIPKLYDASLATTTKRGKVSAKGKFNDFLLEITDGRLKNIEDLDEDTLCDIELLEYFGSYLCNEVWVNGEQGYISLLK